MVEAGIIIVNTRGYILLDTLGAISIVFFVALFLLPIFIQLQEDRKAIEMELKAQHFLYEKLQQYTLQTTSNSFTNPQNQFHYTIHPFEINDLYMKGCVSFETSRKKTITFCDVVKAK